jgi:methionyl-tRNA formyltransferase
MFSAKHNKIDHKTNRSRSVSSLRIYIVLIFILFSGGLVFLRLYVLQVRAHNEYLAYADNQHKQRQTIKPLRGEIFLSDKQQNFPVAVNREMMTAFAIPQEVQAKEYVAKEVAAILDLDYKEVLAKISKQGDLYEVLKRKLSSAEVEKIEQNELEGIHLESERWRYYPGEQVAAHVVGFVGYVDDQIRGQYGIESSFETHLRGSSGFIEQDRDTFGRWISVGTKMINPQQDGDGIVLTLDHVLQFKAELALKNAVERHGADSGKVIIIEPESGRVIAMAVHPTFNLNRYYEVEDMSVFKNSIVSDSYECGSVFKPIVMVAGLDMDKVSPNSTFVDTGQVVEAGYVIKNSDEKSHGKQSMTEVIEKSLNTGAIYVEKQIGNKNFLKYIKDLDVAMVITQPDQPAGRKQQPKKSPVKVVAEDNNRSIEQFAQLDEQAVKIISEVTFDLAVVAAYGLLIPQNILDIKPNHFINVHPSLLPKYRGPSPIQSVLLAGEQKTGTSVMLMERGMDSGPILNQQQLAIEPDDNYDQLEKKLARISNKLLGPTIKDIISGKIDPKLQDHKLASYTKLITKAAGLVDWYSEAEMIYNMHRAFYRWPKIFSYFTDQKEVKKITLNKISVSKEAHIKPGLVQFKNDNVIVGTKTKPIKLELITLEGKKPTKAKDFINGKPNFIEAILHQNNKNQANE